MKFSNYRFLFVIVMLLILVYSTYLIIFPKNHSEYQFDTKEIVVEVVDFFWGGFIAKTSDGSEIPIRLGIGNSIEDVKTGDILKITYRVESLSDPMSRTTKYLDNHQEEYEIYAVIIEPIE